MPCYDPPYDLEQMSASAVQPYVETLAEIDRYCDDMLRELDLHPNKPTDSPQAVGLGKMMALGIKDIVHKRFRDGGQASDSEQFQEWAGRHAYNRHPTPQDPVVRYGSFRFPVDGNASPPEWVRDDGTDNLQSLDED